MSAVVPPPAPAGFRRLAQAVWPLALATPLVASAFYSAFSVDGATSAQVTVQIASVVVAALLCGLAVGGAKGVGATFALCGIAAYCAWWFSLGIDGNISRYSWYHAGSGLNQWIGYLWGMVFNLWPLLLAAGAVTRRAALRRQTSVWRALGLLTLAVVVLATPYRSTWHDGCNYHSGAAPAVLAPGAPALMDIGIGVMPDAGTTQMLCSATGDATWKPFWQGSDGLPAK